ncbi:alanyl-tRNA synthetase [Leuconostoc gelidum subsp. gasicomitatum]|nr:alanyl-tRNA synthetase [Leuconostoc gasicomitatum]MBZ5994644.1 alanyl-tRNA synthetase [Leuconostoc gasicomitatum]
MDILLNQFERRNMPEKKLNRTQLLYLAIASAGLIIVVLLVLLLTGVSSKNTGATIQETGATAKVSSSSSSTKTYVEGKDYSIKYSNSGIVDKATLDKALDNTYTTSKYYSNFIDKNDYNYAKIEILYNKDKNIFIFKNYKVGQDKPNTISSYSISDNKPIGQVTNGYDNLPVVYTWTNLTK